MVNEYVDPPAEPPSSPPGAPYVGPGMNNPIGGGYTASDLPQWGGSQLQFNAWAASTNFANPNPYPQGSVWAGVYEQGRAAHGFAPTQSTVFQPQALVTPSASTSIDYDMSTAAGMAAYVAHMGGTLDPGVNKKA
jgi:hypothetical protein